MLASRSLWRRALNYEGLVTEFGYSMIDEVGVVRVDVVHDAGTNRRRGCAEGLPEEVAWQG